MDKDRITLDAIVESIYLSSRSSNICFISDVSEVNGSTEIKGLTWNWDKHREILTRLENTKNIQL